MKDISKIKQKVRELQNINGGKIFVFPISPDDPFSKYTFTIDTGKEVIVFPNEMGMEEAAGAIDYVLKSFKEEGIDISYEEDVRFIMNEAQVNAPSVTMRRLKKEHHFQPITPIKKDDEVLLSACGVLILTYFAVKDENNAKADRLLNDYCRLLSQRKYGGSTSQIKRNLMLMSREEAVKNLRQVHGKYVSDIELLELFNSMTGTH